MLTMLHFYFIGDWAFVMISIFFAGVIIAVAFLLSYLKFFGSADALALTFISLAMPSFPSMMPIFTISPIQIPFPLSVLFNGVLMSATSIIYAVGRNVTWKIKGRALFQGLEEPKGINKFLALLTGYRVKLSELEKKTHIFPLEEVSIEEGRVVRRLRISLGVRGDKDLVLTALRKLRKRGAPEVEVWVTYGLPMVLFLTVGFVLSLLFGDLIFSILYAVLR